MDAHPRAVEKVQIRFKLKSLDTVQTSDIKSERR